MVRYWRAHTLTWGECDQFSLVYYPHILAWFNDTEHELFRALGHPIDRMIRAQRATFVMGEVTFRFVGPARYGDEIISAIKLERIGTSTLHWQTRCVLRHSGAPISDGRATRVYARLEHDNTLNSVAIPKPLRVLLEQPDPLQQGSPPGGEIVYDF